MPTPHLTPQISAGAMRKLTTDLLRLWRSEGRGGVTLTKSRAKWVLEADVSAPLLWRGPTVGIFRHQSLATINLGTFQSGAYNAFYGGGAFVYTFPGGDPYPYANSLWGASEQWIRIQSGGVVKVQTPSSGGHTSFYDAQEAMLDLWPLGIGPLFNHGGGLVDLLYFDAPYVDNFLGRFNTWFNEIRQQVDPPHFGIIRPFPEVSLPKIVAQDQIGEDATPWEAFGEPYFNFGKTGWKSHAVAVLFLKTSAPVTYELELDIEGNLPTRAHPLPFGSLTLPEHGKEGVAFLLPGGGRIEVFLASGAGAIGDMATFKQTITISGTTDEGPAETVAGGILWTMYDGLARTNSYVAVTAIRIISAVKL